MRKKSAPPKIVELVSAAKRLRSARAACRQFLALWALQQALDCLAASVRDDPRLTDPKSHDWSVLYRGSVLDD